MPLDGRLMMMMDANAYKSAIGSEAVKISHDLGSPPPGSATDDFPVDFDTAGKMLGSGLIAIDPDRLILIANRQATEVLQANEALGLRKGALFIERASIHRTFEAMLKTAVEAHAEGSPPPPSNFLGIPGRSGDIRYAIKIVIVTQRRDRTEILLALIDFFDNQATSRSTVASPVGP